MKNLKAARPDRSKRRPGVAKMVLVPHDKVGAGFMRNVVFPVIAVLGAGSAGYLAVELSRHRQQQSHTAQTQGAALQAAQHDLAQLQRRTDVRKAQLEAAIGDLERRLAQSQATVGTLTATVQAAPQPAGEAVVRPGGINIMALTVSGPSAGPAGRVHPVELTIRRESKLRTPEPLAQSRQAALVNLTWESAPSIQGKLRLVALPEDERDGKRVYLPGKAWRRRNGFDIDLAPGAEQTIAGDLVLPALFEPAYIRVEIFVDHEDGGSIMLRRVYPWPGL